MLFKIIGLLFIAFVCYLIAYGNEQEEYILIRKGTKLTLTAKKDIILKKGE